MMCDIKKRSSFGRLVNYANNKDKARLIDSKDVRTDNNSTIASSMQGQVDDKPGRKLDKSVYHISLSFSKEDTSKLSDGLMAQIAREYMELMGITNTQYIVCRHTDTEHPHMHIVANRVDNDGNTISDRNDVRRSIKICKDLTRKYGLHWGEGKKNVKRNRLRGSDKIRYRILDILNLYIPLCRSWKELEEKLNKQNIRVNFYFDKSKRVVRGVSFTMDNRTFSGSGIDKTMSFYAINSQLKGCVDHKTGAVLPIMEPIFKEKKSEISADYARGKPVISSSKTDKLTSVFDEKSKENLPSDTSDAEGKSSVEDIVMMSLNALKEIVVQPHQVQISSGGGGNDNGDWGDEDKKKRNAARRR